MHVYLFFIFSLFTATAWSCPEDKARELMREEAEALGGPLEDYWLTEDGAFQGRIRANISYWNGQIARATFLVEVNRACRVRVWLRSAE